MLKLCNITMMIWNVWLHLDHGILFGFWSNRKE
jgi:hypothetical protein